MKTIFILFDSLNKRYLQNYGCDWVKTPNFLRLHEKCHTYDNCFTASLPCMPARRDFHTGRLSFLHRSWGPMEPYDNSVTKILSQNGVYTHLISDHFHYWEDGGANYHTKYNSWEIVRGQEGDNCAPCLDIMGLDLQTAGRLPYEMFDKVNRENIKASKTYPIDEIGQKAVDFISSQHEKDNWFLQIESFDPHEPFFADDKYNSLYLEENDDEVFDWPQYKKVTETQEQVEQCRKRYAALVTACDNMLGKVLDEMDKHNMWEDTTLILTTDHGFLLGEHGWWAKTVQPLYTEVSNIPLMVYSPMYPKAHRDKTQLVQICDIAPSILSFYNINAPKEMTGKAIDFSENGTKTRNKNTVITGIHSHHLNITDGKYYFMKAPEKDEFYNYTLMPAHMNKPFTLQELSTAQLCEPFNFTKNTPQMKIKASPIVKIDYSVYGDMLFNLEKDPYCNNPIRDVLIEQKLCESAVEIMKENDAPKETYAYWGLCKFCI